MAHVRIRIQCFAAARERVGTSEVRLEFDSPVTVQLVGEAMVQRFPQLSSLMPHLRIALDEEFAPPDAPVLDGAILALIPPVSGGAAPGLFRLVDEPLDLGRVVEAVSHPSQGGLVTFSGVVREISHGKRVSRLDYEAHRSMAEKKLAGIGAEAQEKWHGVAVAVMHRVGSVRPGDVAVVIAASAPHRADAFSACAHVIDRIKQEVPIWKKEVFDDGEIWVGLGS